MPTEHTTSSGGSVVLPNPPSSLLKWGPISASRQWQWEVLRRDVKAGSDEVVHTKTWQNTTTASGENLGGKNTGDVQLTGAHYGWVRVLDFHPRRGLIAIQERTYASWIAQNRIAELRLANVLPEVSTTTGELTYAGLEWAWETTISETGVENLFRVDVEVSLAGAENSIGIVTGFIGEPTIPGGANTAWSSATQAAGETI